MLTTPAAMAADNPVAAPAASLLPAAGPAALKAPARRGAAVRAARASVRRRVLHLINRQRALYGRRALVPDRRLARAAARHAADMARRDYFAHVSPGGSSPMTRARAAGWHGGVGETLAWGCGSLSTPAAAIRAWMASPPHRAILLGGGHAIGIGFKRAAGCGGGRVYWVAEVG